MGKKDRPGTTNQSVSVSMEKMSGEEVHGVKKKRKKKEKKKGFINRSL